MYDFLRLEGDDEDKERKDEEVYGRHRLPANWRDMSIREKKRLFRNWTRREYKKHIGALPLWMQNRPVDEDEEYD